ncbi:hypothetical protein MLD38_021410 [Melastoma candidum]|uniref:Uncharacterized protein n=1 Tax=Melastoma candidum TaxID=119954 RepID=A0ACB9QG13_9MYRT|nr:hypothetical protein MLD38_021410 [Melastoma candidum]
MDGIYVRFSSDMIPRVLGKSRLCLPRRNSGCLVFCRGDNVYKSGSVTWPLASPDHGAVLMDPGSFIITPSGNDQAAVKDLVPYSGQIPSLVQMEGGIGITRFLRGKNFFITGATGFLAKVLVEKILRTVPDVGKIYVLIKAKTEESARERLTREIINSELFGCIRQTYGKSFEAFVTSKLVPVMGDVSSSSLGIREDMLDSISKEVHIIVNSAANTTFDERYDAALDINTKGPCHLMNFAHRCEKLIVFLQVSTAYVNGQRKGKIKEMPFCDGDNTIVLDNLGNERMKLATIPVLDVERELSLAEECQRDLDDHSAAQQMKEFGLEQAKKYGWQDTYAFTKAMGEMMIDKMRGDIPVVIVRPSIVESTLKEPFPGWMEGNRMMDPVVLYYGKGQLSGFLVDPDGVLDVVPVDMVVNATLAAITKHGSAGKSGISVYQIASSVVNPLMNRELARLLYEHYSASPIMDSQGRPIPVSSMKLFSSMDEFTEYLHRESSQRSGLAAKSVSNAKLSQKLEVICRKSVEQAKNLASLYEPYTFYCGRFDNSNTEQLRESMSEDENMMFGFDTRSIDWNEYITNVHIPGLRRHVMKGRNLVS